MEKHRWTKRTDRQMSGEVWLADELMGTDDERTEGGMAGRIYKWTDLRAD